MEKEINVVFYKFDRDNADEHVGMYVSDVPLEDCIERAKGDKLIQPVKIVTIPEQVLQVRQVLAAKLDLWNQQRLLEKMIGAGDIDDMNDTLNVVCSGLDDPLTLESYDLLFEVCNHIRKSAGQAPINMEEHITEFKDDTGT